MKCWRFSANVISFKLQAQRKNLQRYPASIFPHVPRENAHFSRRYVRDYGTCCFVDSVIAKSKRFDGLPRDTATYLGR